MNKRRLFLVKKDLLDLYGKPIERDKFYVWDGAIAVLVEDHQEKGFYFRMENSDDSFTIDRYIAKRLAPIDNPKEYAENLEERAKWIRKKLKRLEEANKGRSLR